MFRKGVLRLRPLGDEPLDVVQHAFEITYEGLKRKVDSHFLLCSSSRTRRCVDGAFHRSLFRPSGFPNTILSRRRICSVGSIGIG